MREDEAQLEVQTEESDRSGGFNTSAFLAYSLVLSMDHTKCYLAN